MKANRSALAITPKSEWHKFYRHRLAVVSALFLLILSLASLLVPWLSPYGFDQIHRGSENQLMSAAHWFGTDPLGRDLLTRNLYAARNAFFVAICAVALGLAVGMFLGSLAGFYGGLFDLALMRIVDIFFAFPQFLLMVILVAVLGRGFVPLFVAIAVVSWAGYARLVRGLVLQAREENYVEAARSLGASDRHILFRYIFPNITGPILVTASLGVPAAILAESAMSLIGLGLRPPMPSWGSMITEGALQILGYPHLVLFPALFFGLTLLAFTWVGDGLQEVFGRD